jgi:hypothetical protein
MDGSELNIDETYLNLLRPILVQLWGEDFDAEDRAEEKSSNEP